MANDNTDQQLLKFPEENPNPVLRIAKDGRVLYSNMPAKIFLDKWIVDTGNTLSKEWQALISEVCSNEKLREIEEEISGRFFAVTIAPIKELGYANLYALDITERKNSENKLKASNQQLQAAEQQLRAANQQLRASNQQLKATEQQLRAANQQLKAEDQQLRALNQQLKATEEKIRESEARYRSLIESSSDHIFMLSLDGVYLTSNDRVGQFGVESGESLTGRHLHDLYPPDAAKNYLKQLKHVITTGKSIDFEHLMTEPDAEHFYLNTLYPIYRDDQLCAVGGICRDITEKVLAEREILLRDKAIDSCMEGISIVDAMQTDKPIIYVNQGFEQITGYKVDEVLGKNMRFLQGPATDPKKVTRLHQAIKQGRNITVELLNYRKDGSEFWNRVAITPIHNDTNTLTHFIAVHTDISEHKKAQEAIIGSEEKYRRLFEAAQDAILILDAQTGKIKDANPFILNLVGYSHKELVGKEVWEISLFKDIVENKEKFWELKDKKYVRYDHLPLLTKDGNEIYVEFVSNIYSAGGEQVIQCNIRDITERKKAEDIIKKSQKELRILTLKLSTAEEQERKKIAEGIHDSIIQPLIFMDVKVKSLDRITKKAELTQAYREMRKVLGGLIEKARTFTFDLSDPILYELGLKQAMEEYLHTEIEEKHDMKTDFEYNLQTKDLNQSILAFLYKSIKELLVNVVKHADVENISISITQREENIVVYVEDKGHGFAEGIDTKEMNFSNGFGLFNIKEKAEYLGGNLDIKSKTGDGSRITLTIPLKSKL